MTAEEGWSGRRTVALQTVGCKLNQAETDSLARDLLASGHRVVPVEDRPDIYLLNTCTVTHIADHKCRKLLRQAHRNNPDALIIAAGCYAERAPEELGGIEGVGLVVPNRDKDRLGDIVSAALAGRRGRSHGEKNGSAPLRTRALIKIQEGCSRPCAYCIVPRVRGPERSRPWDEIAAEISRVVEEGYREVVLTGTRIGRYSCEGGLRELVELILQTPGLQRLRLSSLEPADLSPELLRLWADPRLCPHIHLPLQSGSDSILERMARPYSTADYMRAMSLARAAIPNLAVTTDVMVGFPGETAEEFGSSYSFCQSAGFAAIHVFPYSRRPGTRAARMTGAVEGTERKRRVEMMLDLARASKERYQSRFLGQAMDVLWEDRKEDVWFGLTDNYLRVLTSSPVVLTNRLLATDLVGHVKGALWGELAIEKHESLASRGIGL